MPFYFTLCTYPHKSERKICFMLPKSQEMFSFFCFLFCFMVLLYLLGIFLINTLEKVECRIGTRTQFISELGSWNRIICAQNSLQLVEHGTGNSLVMSSSPTSALDIFRKDFSLKFCFKQLQFKYIPLIKALQLSIISMVSIILKIDFSGHYSEILCFLHL